MYIKRDIYEKLTEWKDSPSHSTLELNGARQTGKTYIINKFADENFRHKIYINLFDLSGKQFLECYDQATSWTPGTRRPLEPLKDAFKLFDPDFDDTPDTVIIIDEIQESSEIYNRVREFTRQFKARFIITGSYLGKIYEPEFRYSSGDIKKLHIYTLSFEEFLRAKEDALYQRYLIQDYDTFSEHDLDELKALYEVYCQIGGYPKVVETYLTTQSTILAQEELVKIIDTFINESVRYFKDILDIRVFTTIFQSVCRILNREKKGLEENSISEELQKLVTKDYSSNLTKAACNRAISWLYFSGIIGFCGKITEMDILDFKAASRCYFMDMGLASYYLKMIGTSNGTLAGTLSENYVYINLVKRQDFPSEIIFETPAFATYKGGEIDFIAQTPESQTRYLIEVKAGKGTAPTAIKALKDGKADHLLYLKGNARYGVEGKIITLPIYLLEKFQFQ